MVHTVVIIVISLKYSNFIPKNKAYSAYTFTQKIKLNLSENLLYINHIPESDVLVNFWKNPDFTLMKKGVFKDYFITFQKLNASKLLQLTI